MKKYIILIGIVFGCLYNLSAQQTSSTGQYMFNGLYLNPAYAGSHDFTTMTFIVRKQWTGLAGAPLSQFISAEGPVKKNIGLGLVLYNDRIGVTNETGFSTNYAYHIKMKQRGKLSIGLNAGLTLYSAKLSDLTYWDQNDRVFEDNIKNKIIPNLGVGAYYYTDRFYLGFSVPSLINYDPEYRFSINSGNIPHLVQHFYWTTGYAIELSDFVVLKPSVLVKYTKNAPVQADINLNVLLVEKYWVGVTYRTGDAIIGIFDFMIKDVVRIGYLYEYPLSQLNNFSSGTHEAMLGFELGKKKMTVKTPRYF